MPRPPLNISALPGRTCALPFRKPLSKVSSSTKYRLTRRIKPHRTFPSSRYLSHTSQHQTRTMVDDTSYSTFLTKANADPKSGQDSANPDAATRQDSKRQATSEARSRYDPTASNESVPAPLRNLPDIQYVSDTDSDFEPVFFSYSGAGLPSAADFKQILTRQGRNDVDAEVLSVEDFDPRGTYKAVIDKVKEVSSGGEKDGGQEGIVVFRVPGQGARVEYYILTVGDRKLVGLVTKAVES